LSLEFPDSRVASSFPSASGIWNHIPTHACDFRLPWPNPIPWVNHEFCYYPYTCKLDLKQILIISISPTPYSRRFPSH
jgi:hypothetical protein